VGGFYPAAPPDTAPHTAASCCIPGRRTCGGRRPEVGNELAEAGARPPASPPPPRTCAGLLHHNARASRLPLCTRRPPPPRTRRPPPHTAATTSTSSAPPATSTSTSSQRLHQRRSLRGRRRGIAGEAMAGRWRNVPNRAGWWRKGPNRARPWLRRQAPSEAVEEEAGSGRGAGGQTACSPLVLSGKSRKK
jgi:hypothetical protein